MKARSAKPAAAEEQVTDYDTQQITAAERARWLAELSAALADARQVAAELSRSSAFGFEGAEVAQWIEQAIRHVDRLRRGRPVAIANILGPNWLGLSPDRTDRAR